MEARPSPSVGRSLSAQEQRAFGRGWPADGAAFLGRFFSCELGESSLTMARLTSLLAKYKIPALAIVGEH